jgi:hypothetical protein
MPFIGQNIEPVRVDFGADAMAALDKYALAQLELLKQQFSEFHNTKIPAWRNIYLGKPREETKNFPWPNASNVVVQVVGQHVDTLQAKIMAAIYELSPLWPVTLTGKWNAEDRADEQRLELEKFLSYCGLESDILDFYRVESAWCSDCLQFGNGVIKIPVEFDQEVQVLGLSDGVRTDTPITKFEGPRPEKVVLEDFMATPTSPSLEKAPFKVHRLRLSKMELLERQYRGWYPKSEVDKIINNPDANGPSAEKVEQYRKDGLDVSTLYESGEWHIYECWFSYWHNQKKYSLIATYHQSTGTRLRAIFNFYPENDDAFVMARLGHSKDGLLGRGYSDLLEDYQEEVTTGHNQRVDNRTLSNTAIIRLGRNTQFDAHFRFFPGMTIPGEAGEVEVMQAGREYRGSVEEEILTLRLAEGRSGIGISDSTGGSLGSGTVGKTSGAYSAMGTYSVMQEGNRRAGANITDFKYAHMKAGKKIARLYAHFGLGSKGDLFGEAREFIEMALEALTAKRLSLSVKAATASINKEVEKQNMLLLSTIMMKHYTAVGQMLQAVQSPMVDEVLKDYLMKTIKAADTIMEKVLQAFGLDDKSRILPETMLTQEQRNDRAGKAISGAAGETIPELPVGEVSSPEEGEGFGLDALAGMGAS